MNSVDDQDPAAEAKALAETLRQSLAALDQHIEQRAQQIAAERRPDSAATAMQEALEKVDALGELMRRWMLDRLPEGEGRDFTAAIPSVTWKASAAHLLLEICDDEYKEHKKRAQHG
jgi:hypothetical protein